MIEKSVDALPIWMLLSSIFGFIAGELCGDLARRRKCLQQDNAALRNQLEQSPTTSRKLHRELKHHRSVLHDIHKHVRAVTKALQNPPS